MGALRLSAQITDADAGDCQWQATWKLSADLDGALSAACGAVVSATLAPILVSPSPNDAGCSCCYCTVLWIFKLVLAWLCR